MRTLTELMDLSGRSALVSGGAGFLGLAVGEALTELGASIAILDVDGPRSAVRVLQLSKNGARVFAVLCDLRDARATQTATAAAIERMGGLDILIHCAAYVGTTDVPGWAVPFEQQTVDAWDAAMRVNLTSAFVMVQTASPTLAASGRGSVILFSSTHGMLGPDNRLYEGTRMVSPAGYGASKGGLLQLTRFLATTLAPRVRVNAITPGGVWRDQPDSFHQGYVSRTPLGRMAREDDLKGAVAYLASDLSGYVTGHNLVVDGGWSAW